MDLWNIYQVQPGRIHDSEKISKDDIEKGAGKVRILIFILKTP